MSIVQCVLLPAPITCECTFSFYAFILQLVVWNRSLGDRNTWYASYIMLQDAVPSRTRVAMTQIAVQHHVCVCLWVCVCARACVRACVHACVHACVRACEGGGGMGVMQTSVVLNFAKMYQPVLILYIFSLSLLLPHSLIVSSARCPLLSLPQDVHLILEPLLPACLIC